MKRRASFAFPDAPSLESIAIFDPDDLDLMKEDPPQEIDDIDTYHVGLTQAQIDALEDGSLPVVDHMLLDCARGYTVIIGFCERQQKNNARKLRSFIQEHPEFTSLIRPILSVDPEYGGGEIYFERCGDKIKAMVKGFSPYENVENMEFSTEISPDLFKRFVELTEPFGCHMANDGEYPLNF